jgi:hypothetical protein
VELKKGNIQRIKCAYLQHFGFPLVQLQYMEKIIKHITNKNEPKTHVRATRQNFQAQPIIKKMIGTPNKPIIERNFPKKKNTEYLKSEKTPKVCMESTQRNI